MKILAFDEIKSILKKTEHVDYRFNETDRQRALTNPYLDTMRAQLQKMADSLRGTPILEPIFASFKRFEMDGNRRDFESYYFEKRRRLTTFALMSWLYGRDEDICELENIIWAILNEYTWVLPAHLTRPNFANDKQLKNRVGLSTLQEDGYIVDLYSSETAATLSEILSLVGEKLTPILVKRTELYIKTRVLDVLHEDFMWKHIYNNWKAVCGGACAIAAIHQERDIDNLAAVIEMVLPHMKDFCDSYTADGACGEGMGYWIFGFGYFTYFADILKRRTAGEIDLFKDEKVKKMALFFQKCFFPRGKSIVFADAAGSCAFSPDLTSYLASVYEEAVIPPTEYMSLTFNNISRFPQALRNFVWTDDHLAEKAKEVCGTNILEVAEWFMSSSKNGIGLAAKAGNNGEPHNHNDVGSFHIFKNGRMTLADIGCGEYTRDYFGSLRYTYFCSSSASHNVPIVNGNYQLPGADRAARGVSISEAGMSCDIAGTYGDETLKSLVRDIKFNTENGIAEISDSYEFSTNPASVTERFVSFDEPRIEEGRVLFGKDEISILKYNEKLLSPHVSTEIYSNHSGVSTTVYIVDLQVNNPSRSFDVKLTIL